MRFHRITRIFRSGKSEEGSTVLEFGSVVIMFCMLTFGIMDFGRALFAYHFISHVTREATRYAIVRGAVSGTPVTADDISNYVKAMTPLGIDPSDITVTTTWTPDNNPGSKVRIEVDDDFHFILPLLPKHEIQMSSASEMVISQ
jgi:Flp pilus assembly protein TadG